MGKRRKERIHPLSINNWKEKKVRVCKEHIHILIKENKFKMDKYVGKHEQKENIEDFKNK